MAAKKTLLGEALAKKLGWRYIDANPSLERYIGRSLLDILGRQGEESFHQCEAEIITRYKSEENVVVVLEEGVVANEQNRKLLTPEYVVYSKVSVAEQLERMEMGRVPLLPINDLEAFLNKQHQERDSLYEEVASLTIDFKDVEKDIEQIVSHME